MDAVELKRLRELRKSLASKLAKSAEEALDHIENGSFEAVEDALIECQASICGLRDKLEEKKNKRHKRNAEPTETGQPG